MMMKKASAPGPTTRSQAKLLRLARRAAKSEAMAQQREEAELREEAEEQAMKRPTKKKIKKTSSKTPSAGGGGGGGGGGDEKIADMIEKALARRDREWFKTLAAYEVRLDLLEERLLEKEEEEESLGKTVEKNKGLLIGLLKKLNQLHTESMTALESKLMTLESDHREISSLLVKDVKSLSKSLTKLREQVNARVSVMDGVGGGGGGGAAASDMVSFSRIAVESSSSSPLIFGHQHQHAASSSSSSSCSSTSLGPKVPHGATHNNSLQVLASRLEKIEREQKEKERVGASELKLLRSYFNELQTNISELEGEVASFMKKRGGSGDGVGGSWSIAMSNQQAKIEAVSQYASKACRVLSQSVNEVQQSIVLLYRFSDQVAQQLKMPLVSRDVGRWKVPSPQKTTTSADQSSQWFDASF